jgi:hypothetical protein
MGLAWVAILVLTLADGAYKGFSLGQRPGLFLWPVFIPPHIARLGDS